MSLKVMEKQELLEMADVAQRLEKLMEAQHISVLVLHLKHHIQVYHSLVAHSHKKQTGMTSICH